MAALPGHGRVLPEWAAAHVDRLVRAAFSAQVPRGHGVRDAGAGGARGVDAFSAATVAHCFIYGRDAVADRHHLDGELHVSELPGSRAWLSAVGRRVSRAVHSAALERALPRGSKSGASYRSGQTSVRRAVDSLAC